MNQVEPSASQPKTTQHLLKYIYIYIYIYIICIVRLVVGGRSCLVWVSVLHGVLRSKSGLGLGAGAEVVSVFRPSALATSLPFLARTLCVHK